ncbi:Nucleolar GTP-binding protein 1 [Linum perenne]
MQTTKYLRYQVVDTPGILGRPFKDMNIIEDVQHYSPRSFARCCFSSDLSGPCGYSIAQQVALFHSIESLFMNKPVATVRNKADLQPLEVLNDEDEKLVVDMKAEALKTLVGQGGKATDDESLLLTMSTLTARE